jgi:hypothetical protein
MDQLQNKSKLWALMLIDADFDDARLSLAARGVYVHLCRRADKAHVAWPGIDSIAETCRISKPTVIRAIRELEERGFLQVMRRNGCGANYEILPKHWLALSGLAWLWYGKSVKKGLAFPFGHFVLQTFREFLLVEFLSKVLSGGLFANGNCRPEPPSLANFSKPGNIPFARSSSIFRIASSNLSGVAR